MTKRTKQKSYSLQLAIICAAYLSLYDNNIFRLKQYEIYYNGVSKLNIDDIIIDLRGVIPYSDLTDEQRQAIDMVEGIEWIEEDKEFIQELMKRILPPNL